MKDERSVSFINLEAWPLQLCFDFFFQVCYFINEFSQIQMCSNRILNPGCQSTKRDKDVVWFLGQRSAKKVNQG